MRFQRPLLFIVLLAIAGCARAVAVRSESNTPFAISVENSLAYDMVVSYDAGAGSRVLGTVRAGDEVRFVIAGPASTTISVTGRNDARDRQVGPLTVSLISGQTVPVRLR